MECFGKRVRSGHDERFDEPTMFLVEVAADPWARNSADAPEENEQTEALRTVLAKLTAEQREAVLW